MPTEQRMLEGWSLDPHEYVRGVREMLQQRREQLEAMEQAMDDYEAACLRSEASSCVWSV